MHIHSSKTVSLNRQKHGKLLFTIEIRPKKYFPVVEFQFKVNLYGKNDLIIIRHKNLVF